MQVSVSMCVGVYACVVRMYKTKKKFMEKGKSGKNQGKYVSLKTLNNERSIVKVENSRFENEMINF